MTGLNAGHVGIAGEVRCVVRCKDGVVKNDTGFQKNLILNQGLDFFGGGKGENIFNSCVIGSGNTTPSPTQNSLSSFVAISSGVLSSVATNYTPSADNLYKTNMVYKYDFTGLGNINLSEVGLVSQGTTSLDYYLCTRALLRDALGVPTSIAILTGEVLEVYYKLWRVVSVTPVSYAVKMLDGKGGEVPYTVEVKPVLVGNADYWGRLNKPVQLIGTGGFYSSPDEVSSITTSPAYAGTVMSNYTNSAYVPNSFKRIVSIAANVNNSNAGIRALWSDQGSTLPFQVRFGSVASDGLIPKTNLQTLSMPFEFSWGRYEGVL